jgi:hypothetical protein
LSKGFQSPISKSAKGFQSPIFVKIASKITNFSSKSQFFSIFCSLRSQKIEKIRDTRLERGMEEQNDAMLVGTCESLMHMFTSISADRYEDMENHFDALVQYLFEVIKYASRRAYEQKESQQHPAISSEEESMKATEVENAYDRNQRRGSAVDSGAIDQLAQKTLGTNQFNANGANSGTDCAQLMFLAVKNLAALSTHEEVRELIETHDYLEIETLRMFLSLPHENVLAEFFIFLNNCCQSEALFAYLSREEAINPLIRHALVSDCPEIIVQVARLCYCFSLVPETLTVLRQEQSVEAVFAIVRKGNPQAQEVAIQAIYHLAIDPMIKRAIIRKGLLDALCQMTKSGPVSVQPHAAWLIASLVVRGGSRDLMFQKNTLNVLVQVLTAENPKVVVQAAWALSHLPIEASIIARLADINGIVLLCRTLCSTHPAVLAQGALTIAALAKNRMFRDHVQECGAISLLVSLLHKSADEKTADTNSDDNSSVCHPDVQTGVAAAMRELSQDEENAITFSESGVATGLVQLMLSQSRRVRSAALAAVVPLLSVTDRMPMLLDAGVMGAMLSEHMLVEDREERGGESDWSQTANEPSRDLGFKGNDDTSLYQSLAKAIRMFASNDAAKEMFRRSNGFDLLMQLANSTEPEVQVEVAYAIGVLASDPESETMLAEIGAIDILHADLQVCSEAVQRRAQWSLSMLTSDALRYNLTINNRIANAQAFAQENSKLATGMQKAIPQQQLQRLQSTAHKVLKRSKAIESIAATKKKDGDQAEDDEDELFFDQPLAPKSPKKASVKPSEASADQWGGKLSAFKRQSTHGLIHSGTKSRPVGAAKKKIGLKRSRPMSLKRGDVDGPIANNFSSKRRASRKSETPKFAGVAPTTPKGGATAGVDKLGSNASKNDADAGNPASPKRKNGAKTLGDATKDLKDLIFQMKSLTEGAGGDNA